MRALLLAALGLLLPALAAADGAAAHPAAATAMEWDLLLRRVRARPDSVSMVDGYRVSVVLSDVPIPGEQCPGSRVPRNQLFLAEPAGPNPPYVLYYLRIAAVCVGAADAPDLLLFSLDAGRDGVVSDWSLGDTVTGRVVNGFSGSPTPAQSRELERYRDALVRQFLSH